jgi:hypothetical protein
MVLLGEVVLAIEGFREGHLIVIFLFSFLVCLLLCYFGLFIFCLVVPVINFLLCGLSVRFFSFLGCDVLYYDGYKYYSHQELIYNARTKPHIKNNPDIKKFNFSFELKDNIGLLFLIGLLITLWASFFYLLFSFT